MFGSFIFVFCGFDCPGHSLQSAISCPVHFGSFYCFVSVILVVSTVSFQWFRFGGFGGFVSVVRLGVSVFGFLYMPIIFAFTQSDCLIARTYLLI